MRSEFWLNKWQNNEIGFHRSSVNPLLVEYFPCLSLAPGSHVFLPLCGKTLDIHWLLLQGYVVSGAELSEKAVLELFRELGVEPMVEEQGPFIRYSHQQLNIFQGDFFALQADDLKPVDAVYDRAALVALPGDMRPKYAAHLREITHQAPQLLVTYEYDQSLVAGPPFSVTQLEVTQLYQQHYQLKRLASFAVEGGLKGRYEALERVWHLQNTAQ